MLKHRILILEMGIMLIVGETHAAKALGPLRVQPNNLRYFADGTENPDGSLKAV